MKTTLSLWFSSSLLLIGLPLLGLVFENADLLYYLEFPPLTRYVIHAPFDPLAFIIIGAVEILMLSGFIVLFKRGFRQYTSVPFDQRPKYRFPAWGILGSIVMISGWVLAWTRFSWFEPLQAHTFCIPWVGYIIVVNALCIVRSGQSLVTDAPVRFLLLFPSSAVFWWYFEYLNRYVQNWYFVGVETFTKVEYVFHASLAFSTVLPAVLSTHRLLLTYRIFNSGLKSSVSISFLDNRHTAGLILLVAGAALVCIAKYPDYLYPLVWGAPLLVITSLQTLSGRPNLFNGLKRGDWRALLAAAIATLICGFFWELWNYKSLARWEYAVPFVNRFHIFAMPALGYASYLPFGWECLLAGQLILGGHLLRIPNSRPADG